MTSFGYWADRIPAGQFLCVLCWEVFPITEAWQRREDVCQACGEAERRLIEEMRLHE